METTALQPNLRTNQQNRHLYWLFGKLNINNKDAIADIVWHFTEGTTSQTSELGFIECQNLIRYLNNILKSGGTHPTQAARIDRKHELDAERMELDRKRKGVLKAIFRWGELQGLQYTMEYVKSIACKAAGRDRFNDISPAELTRIYYEFCGKQKVLGVKNRNYQPFCLN
jgi:hypothetical protein